MMKEEVSAPFFPFPPVPTGRALGSPFFKRGPPSFRLTSLSSLSGEGDTRPPFCRSSGVAIYLSGPFSTPSGSKRGESACPSLPSSLQLGDISLSLHRQLWLFSDRSAHCRPFPHLSLSVREESSWSARMFSPLSLFFLASRRSEREDEDAQSLIRPFSRDATKKRCPLFLLLPPPGVPGRTSENAGARTLRSSPRRRGTLLPSPTRNENVSRKSLSLFPAMKMKSPPSWIFSQRERGP